jgi:hypothetical protein
MFGVFCQTVSMLKPTSLGSRRGDEGLRPRRMNRCRYVSVHRTSFVAELVTERNMGKPWKTNHSNGLLWMILTFFLIEMVPFLWGK